MRAFQHDFYAKNLKFIYADMSATSAEFLMSGGRPPPLNTKSVWFTPYVLLVRNKQVVWLFVAKGE